MNPKKLPTVKILCLLLISAFPVLSYQAEAQQQSAIDFKGLPLGSSLDEFQQRFPEFYCAPGTGGGADQYCNLSPELTCLKVNPSTANAECRDKVNRAMTYGGSRAKAIGAYFYNGIGLGSVKVRTDPQLFETLLALLVEKHGKPGDFNIDQIQNRMGAKFENATAIWILPTGQINAVKYDRNLVESSISLSSTAHMAEFQKRSAARREKSKPDL